MIEENSPFTTDSPDYKIINRERKVRHIRKLEDFEVLMLLFQELKIDNS